MEKATLTFDGETTDMDSPEALDMMKKVETFRTDTGEMIDTRDMTQNELQGKIS